jgi:hypothetical protein
MTTWRPRSSTLGAYFGCDFRAAFDRLIHEGKIEKPEDQTSPYADFGTCTHYKLQTSIGAVFPDGNHSPSDEQRANAASLHANGKLDDMIEKVAACARQNLPISPDGKPWLAEAEFKLRTHTGHIDFLSQDYTVIGDLKTTSRKPDHQRVKADHLWQGVAYKLGVKGRFKVDPQKLWILYVDSLRAQWSMLVWIDLQSEAILELEEHALHYIKYLRSAQLYKQARPRMGSNCSGSFCPHVARCRDRFIPGPAPLVETTVAPTAPSVSSFLAPKG